MYVANVIDEEDHQRMAGLWAPSAILGSLPTPSRSLHPVGL